MLPNSFFSSVMNSSSSSLFLIIVLCFVWINFLFMTMSTVKRVWLDGLYKSGGIEWLSNFSELAWRNIRPITKFELLMLSAYYIGTCKEIRLMTLWFKKFFLSKNHRWDNIGKNSWDFPIVTIISCKHDLWQMIGSTTDFFIFLGWCRRNGIKDRPRWFLNKNNVKIFVVF